MGANIGQGYEQTKPLDGFPYNAVGEIWVVNNIQGKYIILKNSRVGLGVNEQELKEHFKLDTSYSDYDNNDYDDEVHEDEDADNKQVGKLNTFLRKLGFGKKD